MLNDLIVTEFDSKADALKAQGGLEIMRNSQLLGVSNTILVRRDSDGSVIVHQQRESSEHQPDLSSQVAGLLARAIFAQPPKTRTEQFVRSGLDRRFVVEVASALAGRSAMLVNYVRRGSLVDTQRLLGTLNQFKCTLYHTTVPVEVEEAILNQSAQE